MQVEPIHKTLTTPKVYLWRMIMFLTLVGFIGAILYAQFWTAFKSNPALNGLILFMLFVGILYAFRQIFRLYPEIRWINNFRISDPGFNVSKMPVLLSPMATMLRDRTGHLSLSTTSMRSLMDSIGARLDEARDTSRYLVGLLIFLGLLGTFWGLLETIQSVGQTISALNPSAGDSLVIFEELINGLKAPLQGMGTAFSSSLFGLAGSLVLGFLDLQASQAHNRFYNELEDWLSSITELTPAEDGGSLPEHIAYMSQELQRSLDIFGERVQIGLENNNSDQAVKDLADGIDKLVKQMRAEQKVVREWVDEQAAQQTELAVVLRDFSTRIGR